MPNVPKKHIIVIGGGIIGLQSALTLLEAGYAVTLIAEHLPDSADSLGSAAYTSPWAGAQFRPHAAPNTEAASWESQTYAYFHRLVSSPPYKSQNNHRNHKQTNSPANPTNSHPSSITALPFLNSFASLPAQIPPWWTSLPHAEHQPLAAAPSPPKVEYAYRMQSFTLDPATYLGWVLDQARALGLRTVRTRVLPKRADVLGLVMGACDAVAAEEASTITAAGQPLRETIAVVNATGLAARMLVPDDKVYPVRGQTLTVSGVAREMRTHVFPTSEDRVQAEEVRDGLHPNRGVLAVIPHPARGETILGSTRWPGSWVSAENLEDTRWLLARGRECCGELLVGGDFWVLRVNVGLRPGRVGGPRVEREKEFVQGMVLVHAYGHDGAGFQQSVGVARKVLALIREGEGNKAKL